MRIGKTYTDIYKEYVKDRRRLNLPSLSLVEYTTACRTIGDCMTEALQQHKRLIIKEIGVFELFKYLPKKAYIDFHSTKLYGKLIYHRNTHTKGFQVRFRWSRRVPNMSKEVQAYNFKATRTNTRDLAKRLKTDPNFIYKLKEVK